MPFFPLILAERGLDAGEIAAVMAASPLLRIATAPWLGSLSDRFRHRRNAALLYSVVAAVLIVPLLWAEGFLSILIITSISAIFWLSVLPVVDALSVVAAKHNGLQYGRMRLWGSLAFIGANFLAGWLLDFSGSELLLLAIVAAFGLTALATLALPRDRVPHDAVPASQSYWSMPALHVIRSDPPVAIALFAAALGQASHAMVYAFGTIHWKSFGLSGLEIGMAWGVGVVAEVLLFAGAGKIVGRRAPEILILTGLSAGIVRWGLAPFASDASAIVGLQILHGITFGATHLGAMRVIADRLPNDHAGGALGIYAAMGGLAMSGAFAISGRLYQTFAGYGFWAMSVMCLVSMICLLLVIPKAGRYPHKSASGG